MKETGVKNLRPFLFDTMILLISIYLMHAYMYIGIYIYMPVLLNENTDLYVQVVLNRGNRENGDQ
jgi:hypothetical protein